MKRRQKYYFLDYTEKVSITKRILKILPKQKKDKNSIYTVCSEIVFIALRWKNLKGQSIDASIHFIDTAFDILQQLEIVELINKKCGCEEDIYKYSYKITLPDADFDTLIKNSGFSPVQGTKQILTPEMKDRFKTELNIDYNNLLSLIDINDGYRDQITKILPKMIYLWKQSYCKMGNPRPYIMGFSFDTYEVLFDQIEEYPDDGADTLADGYIEERTIVAYGYSSKPQFERGINDINMRVDDQRKWADKETDRGHFIAHAIGGNIWVNIFPQRRDINRGASEAGKRYKAMEKYLLNNEGIFCFSRPIYFDFYNRPYLIEYGYIDRNFELIIEIFENV